MTVIGSNFGLAEDSPAVLVGPTNAFVTGWQSHTSIVIRPRGGHGPSPILQFQVASQSSVLSSHFSYNSAQVSSVLSASVLLPATGASIMSLYGANLGDTDYSVTFSKISVTSSEHTRWKSDTTVVVKVSSGVGSVLTSFVTFSNFVGSLTASVSYQQPNSVTLTPLFIPTSGFPALSVSGSWIWQFFNDPECACVAYFMQRCVLGLRFICSLQSWIWCW
jgi:hypothetical protein